MQVTRPFGRSVMAAVSAMAISTLVVLTPAGADVGTTVTAIAVSVLNDPSTYGTTVQLDETGLPGDATGTVVFLVDGNQVCSDTYLGTDLACQLTAAAGSHAVEVQYSGDATYAASLADSSFTVNQATSAVSASVQGGPYAHGDVVSLVASGLAGDATGTVTFSDGAGTLCVSPVVSGSATCATSSLATGTDQVDANFSGDANYLGSTSTTSVVVNQAVPTAVLSTSGSPGVYGATLTVSLADLPADATGTVNFRSANGIVCSSPVSASVATCAVVLPVGSYAISADYSGDINYQSASFGPLDPSQLTVNQAATSFVASATAGVAHGSTVTLGTSSLPSDATGSVTFTSNASTLCVATVSAGSASCTTDPSLLAGHYDVTATYSGDANYLGSSATTWFDVATAAVSPLASVLGGPYAHGQQISLRASNLPLDATGTVTFFAGAMSICLAPVTAGAASCSGGASLAAGHYVVFANYSGDVNYQSATASTSLDIARASSTFSANGPITPVAHGTTGQLTATGLASDATGSVTFTSNSMTLCSATVTSGSGSCTVSGVLGAATYVVTATYSGDTNYQGASATASYVVIPASTNLNAHQTNVVHHGQAPSFIASGFAADATGTVTFTGSAGVICVASVLSGGASCSGAASLPAGSDSVSAAYSGDANYLGAAANLTMTIGVAPSSLTVGAVGGPYRFGQSVTIQVAALPSDATGTVTFTIGSTTLCAVSVTVGGASCAATLPAGINTVLATYGGDTNYAGSSASTLVAVQQASPVMTASTGAPTPYGHLGTFSISILGAHASGQVVMKIAALTLCKITVVSGAGSCQAAITLLPGTYVVIATYGGDRNYKPSAVSAKLVVIKAAVAPLVTAGPNPDPYGHPVALAMINLPAAASGTVSFQSGPLKLCVATVTSGSAFCFTSATLPVARYVSAATYSGDAHFLGWRGYTAFVVERAASAMKASVAPTSVPFGHAVALHATGFSSNATGTVVFKSGTLVLCQTTVHNATATCVSGSNYPVRTYSVLATYFGDANHLPATATTSFTVVKAATQISASASPIVAPHGTPVTLSATGLPGAATGTVTFTIGLQVLCVGHVSGGAAACRTASNLAKGTYYVVATYSGDANLYGSKTSTAFKVV